MLKWYPTTVKRAARNDADTQISDSHRHRKENAPLSLHMFKKELIFIFHPQNRASSYPHSRREAERLKLLRISIIMFSKTPQFCNAEDLMLSIPEEKGSPLPWLQVTYQPTKPRWPQTRAHSSDATRWILCLISYKNLTSTNLALTSSIKQHEIYTQCLKNRSWWESISNVFVTPHSHKGNNPKDKMKFRGLLVPVLAKYLIIASQSNPVDGFEW